MILDDAFEVHVGLIRKIRRAIQFEEALDADSCGNAHFCKLGIWLNGPGLDSYADRAEFKLMVDKHQQFHRVAGFVARMINAKRFESANKIIEAGMPLAAAAEEMIQALLDLKNLRDREFSRKVKSVAPHSSY
jgi:hypothetical protein